MGYIYKIKNKINNKVYIGQTRGHYQHRWEKHLKTAFSDAPSYVKRRNSIHLALRKYGVENFEFSVVEKVDNDLLDSRERYWVEQENSFYNGYNETRGGSSGGLYYDYDKIYKIYLSNYDLIETAKICNCGRDTVRAAVLAHDVKPIDFYQQYKKKRHYDYKSIADCYREVQNLKEVSRIYGCDVDVVHKACLENNVPILAPGLCTQKKLGVPISQIDLSTLKIIATYPSACNAAIKVFGDKAKSRNILACCRREQKTAYGYGWIFEGDDIPDNLLINEKKRQVKQIDKNTGQVLNIFESGAAAAKYLGKKENAAGVILSVCRQPDLHSAYGYNWEYGDQ